MTRQIAAGNCGDELCQLPIKDKGQSDKVTKGQKNFDRLGSEVCSVQCADWTNGLHFATAVNHSLSLLRLTAADSCQPTRRPSPTCAQLPLYSFRHHQIAPPTTANNVESGIYIVFRVRIVNKLPEINPSIDRRIFRPTTPVHHFFPESWPRMATALCSQEQTRQLAHHDQLPCHCKQPPQ